ncbi:hypothetical protein F4778DRAFT_173504 [Xylariomycetidae sp. FL2044]|nr:hypothetical protein F4778DRAFT_173504 [Xylariomycetidae sp. FL2044]
MLLGVRISGVTHKPYYHISTIFFSFLFFFFHQLHGGGRQTFASSIKTRSTDIWHLSFLPSFLPGTHTIIHWITRGLANRIGQSTIPCRAMLCGIYNKHTYLPHPFIRVLNENEALCPPFFYRVFNLAMSTHVPL